MKKRKHHSRLHRAISKANKLGLFKNIIWILAILFIFYISIKIIGTEGIQDKVANAGIYGPLILILAKASTVVFAPLGGVPLYLASGTLFGFYKGLIYVLIGDFIGFTVSFYISRIFGKRVASYFLSQKGMEAVKEVIIHMGTKRGLIQSCLVFIGFPEAVSYGAGLTKIPYIKTIPLMLAIEAIPVAVLVGLGKAAITNFGTSSLVLINIIVFLVVFFGVFWLHREAKKDSKSHKNDLEEE